MLREINGGKENKRAAVRCRDEKCTGLWIALENSPWPPTVAFGGIMLIKCSELIERKSWFIGPDVSGVWKKKTLLKAFKCPRGAGRGVQQGTHSAPTARICFSASLPLHAAACCCYWQSPASEPWPSSSFLLAFVVAVTYGRYSTVCRKK